jgi:hypothetical protein
MVIHSRMEELDMYEELIKARNTDLSIARQTIEHRMEWAEISRMDRLERALRATRSRLRMLPNLTTETN